MNAMFAIYFTVKMFNQLYISNITIWSISVLKICMPSSILNKNGLSVIKVQGQSEAAMSSEVKKFINTYTIVDSQFSQL